MRTYRISFSLLALSALYVTASAQSYAVQESVDWFSLSVSDYNSVQVSYVSGGPYTNGIPQISTGASYNYFETGGAQGEYTYAVNESVAYTGMASQFNGDNFLIDFSNTSDIDQTFTVSESLEEYQETSGDATAISYGGFEEYGGAYAFGYNTAELDPDGITTISPYGGFTGGYEVNGYDESLYFASGGFTDTLAPGQSIEVQVWASGSTSAVSSVPAPAAALSFGLIGLVRRRRK